MKPGILHFGLGAFHRAHQADFTQDANLADGADWVIEAIAMRNPELAYAINENNQFHLLIKAPGGIEFKPISVIKRAACLAEGPRYVAECFEDPNRHIVTITVTEKGYGLNRATGGLNLEEPIIIHDLENPHDPKGLMGILVEGLRRRKAAGGKGMTLISCDNLPANGKLLKHLVLEFARLRDKKLTEWIENNCTFPSSMIDRITPASTAKTVELVKQRLGVTDELAVETEPFRQWVIEDHFAGPRPSWEKAGVIFTDNVEPYELMKLRMLNGAHSLIAYLGTWLEMPAVRDVMADTRLAGIVDLHMEVASKTLPSIQGFDLTQYMQALIERFANPAIDHRCMQIAMDGSQKMPQRIFAPAKSRLEDGISVQSFALATALWMRHLNGQSAFGTSFELNDPLGGTLQNAMAANANNPVAQVLALGNIKELETHGLFSNQKWQKTMVSALEMLNHTEKAGISSKDDVVRTMKDWLAE